ncbi:hypothetical protein J6590_052832 [Homalodisca vitripennis]|nr:hypothetical protein J6590_052832 [Homalodisca vitripennis]
MEVNILSCFCPGLALSVVSLKRLIHLKTDVFFRELSLCSFYVGRPKINGEDNMLRIKCMLLQLTPLFSSEDLPLSGGRDTKLHLLGPLDNPL